MIARRSRLNNGAVLLAAAVMCLAGASELRAQTSSRTLITLKETAEVRHNLVTLGDIATFDGPSAPLIRRLESVDLIQFDRAGDRDTISSRQVVARLLLEGVLHDSFRLNGATETSVSLAPKSVTLPQTNAIDYQADVVAQAVEALSKAWLARPEDIQVDVISTQTGMVAVDGSLATPELELPARLEPGRIQARLRWTHNGKIERLEQVSLDVQLRQTIVRASHSILRGESLSPANLVEERQLLSTRVQQVAAEQLVGAVARRDIKQGDSVTPKDLSPPKAAPPTVRARSAVHVVAKKGGLRVELLAAEVLTPGYVGDLVQVRNPETGKVFAAKVVASDLVELPLF